MSKMLIRNIQPGDQPEVQSLLARQWGSEIVISRGKIYNASFLAGFLAEQEGQIVGLATYQVAETACELVTLDSFKPGEGIGTALVEKVKQVALEAGCYWLWLITTNDNLHALGFYQKRGFRLAALYPGAIEISRKIKPQIPLIGENGIPIRDEIQLQLALNREEFSQ